MEIASADRRVQRVSNQTVGHEPGSAVSGLTTKSAKLFPDLFRDIDPDKRLRVLEIGRAQPETVAFFSSYKCRLTFADLYSDVDLFQGQASATEAELAKGFRKTLAIPKGEKFDLCLMWDVMQYLSGRAIRALCGALEPHLHEETRAHGFGVHSILTPCERAEYAIANMSEFVMRKERIPDLQYLPHPQAELSELLTVFKIERAILMGDGTVEMFLASKPYWD